jgi:signal transduction histidine kinase
MERLDKEKNVFDDQMIQSQKLAAIGQLSAGIAHEINNPLAIIGEEAGWMQDLLKREAMSQLPEMVEIQDSLREIVVQAGRCKEITHKLLSFARKMDSTIRDVDVNALVDDVVGMREREATLDNIQIIKDLETNLPIIHSEPSQLRQVLLNLVNNAIDAIPHGGTITVHTEKSGADDGGVAFSVADTGIGTPRENIEKIFDPFFTTKLPGKGTGLGLSICHGIIQKLGGTITVSSDPARARLLSACRPPRHPARANKTGSGGSGGLFPARKTPASPSPGPRFFLPKNPFPGERRRQGVSGCRVRHPAPGEPAPRRNDEQAAREDAAASSACPPRHPTRAEEKKTLPWLSAAFRCRLTPCPLGKTGWRQQVGSSSPPCMRGDRPCGVASQCRAVSIPTPGPTRPCHRRAHAPARQHRPRGRLQEPSCLDAQSGRLKMDSIHNNKYRLFMAARYSRQNFS